MQGNAQLVIVLGWNARKRLERHRSWSTRMQGNAQLVARQLTNFISDRLAYDRDRLLARQLTNFISDGLAYDRDRLLARQLTN